MSRDRDLLLVAHDPRELRFLEFSLRRAGFSVTAFRSAALALEIVGDWKPDAVVTDTAMPEIDGFELRTRLRAKPALRAIPILFLARESNIDDRVRVVEEGGPDDFVLKPIRGQEIARRARLLISRRACNRLERGSEAVSLDGTLADIGVADLVALLGRSRRSGTLRMTRGAEEGRLFFRDGRVVDAAWGRTVGERAFFRLLLWEEGDFEFAPGAVICEERIAIGAQALLQDGLRRVGEWDELRRQLAPMSRIFEVDYAVLALREPEIPTEVHGILKLFDGRRTLRQVTEDAGCDDLLLLSAIGKLHAQGLIVDVPLGAETSSESIEAAVAAWIATAAPEVPEPATDATFSEAPRAQTRAPPPAPPPIAPEPFLPPAPESVSALAARASAALKSAPEDEMGAIIAFPRSARRVEAPLEAGVGSAGASPAEPALATLREELEHEPPATAEIAPAASALRGPAPPSAPEPLVAQPPAPAPDILTAASAAKTIVEPIPLDVAALATAEPAPIPAEPAPIPSAPASREERWFRESAKSRSGVRSYALDDDEDRDSGRRARLLWWGGGAAAAAGIAVGLFFALREPKPAAPLAPTSGALASRLEAARPAALSGPVLATRTPALAVVAPSPPAPTPTPPPAPAPVPAPPAPTPAPLTASAQGSAFAKEPPSPEKKPEAAKPPVDDKATALKALLKKGNALFRRGRFPAAIDVFEKALASHPENVDAEWGLGRALYDSGKEEASLRHLERVAELRPGLADVYVRLGALYQAKGQSNKAKKAYETYLKKAPRGKFVDDVRSLLQNL